MHINYVIIITLMRMITARKNSSAMSARKIPTSNTDGITI